MAKGEHKKINRPVQGGYDISLDPQGYGKDGKKVTWVTVRFGTLQGKDEDGNIYKWDLSIGPIEFNSETKKKVITVDDDQLPPAARPCYYQMLCEIEENEKDPDKPSEPPERLITDPTLLTAVVSTS